MLDVKQLRVLKAVAEHGSFSAAADALSYTQPAVSQQIAALEKQSGATLVDRGSRGVRLTDAGRALVQHAEVVIARLAAAEAELEAIRGVRGGRVRLSSFPTAGASLLPPAVALFTQRYPDVELSFVEEEPEEAVQMLRAAELEVAIAFEYKDLSQPEFDRLYEGVELRHLIDDPDVHRRAARPPRGPQAACAARGLRRGHLDPERHARARAGACTWRPASGRASSRRSPTSRTTTTWCRA